MSNDPVITAIEVVASDPNLRRIETGGGTVATLPARDVEALGLSVGIEVTDDVARQIDLALVRARVRHDALALLSRRALPRAEIARRLVARSFPAEAGAAIVDELTDDGWLDDETYARDLAAEVVRRKPAAAAFIRQRLMAKGIDESLAERIARDVAAETGDDEAALALARAERGAGPAAVRRIGATLARRGFDEDTIRRTLDRLGHRLEHDAAEGVFPETPADAPGETP